MTAVLVLWDLDLTLLSASGFGRRLITPVLAGLTGRAPDLDIAYAGRTDRAICAELLARNGVADADGSVLERFMGLVAERYELDADDLVAGGGRALPGALDTVAHLAADARVRQGVVTGNMRRSAVVKLRGCGFGTDPDVRLGGFGDAHTDRADLVRGALAAAAGLGVPVAASRCVVVGDTVHDVAGARDAGTRSIAVATGPATAGELRAAGADAVLPDLTDPRAVSDAVWRVVDGA